MARHVNAVVVPTLIRMAASELGRIFGKNIFEKTFSLVHGEMSGNGRRSDDNVVVNHGQLNK